VPCTRPQEPPGTAHGHGYGKTRRARLNCVRLVLLRLARPRCWPDGGPRPSAAIVRLHGTPSASIRLFWRQHALVRSVLTALLRQPSTCTASWTGSPDCAVRRPLPKCSPSRNSGRRAEGRAARPLCGHCGPAAPFSRFYAPRRPIMAAGNSPAML